MKIYKNAERSTWQVPEFKTIFWTGRKSRHCVIIPVINEGNRIKSLLQRILKFNIHVTADIIIIDGGTTDGSLEISFLSEMNIAGLLLKTGSGKLSAQLRCAYSFALDQGYDGIITIDGNDKDDPEAIPRFIESLNQGFDFVQASRFLPGGIARNTPIVRNLAIRMIHAPLLSVTSGFKWTDTTQGFRGYSAKILLDPQIAPFRDIFETYELLAYLSYRVPKLGYKCIELASTRAYPLGKVPTKISLVAGQWLVLKILLQSCLGKFNPPNNVR